MRCDEDDCECFCHDDFGDCCDCEHVSIIGAIDTYFQPAMQPARKFDNHDRILLDGLDGIEESIDGLPDDLGKLYPLHERVARVIAALQARSR